MAAPGSPHEPKGPEQGSLGLSTYVRGEGYLARTRMTTRFTVLPTACATGLTSPSTCAAARVSDAARRARLVRRLDSAGGGPTLKANSLYVYRYHPDRAMVVASLVAVIPFAVVATSQAACRHDAGGERRRHYLGGRMRRQPTLILGPSRSRATGRQTMVASIVTTANVLAASMFSP
jgi:hypothetical protein